MPQSQDLSLRGPIAPARSGKADSLVIMLHGVGADGNDLFGLVPHLAPHLPNTVFASPDAPFAYDMAPFGQQWFSLMDRTPTIMQAGVEATAPILNAYIDELLSKLELGADRLVLLGFSQGTMMSLHVAPRRAEQIAGVIGFSGRLLDTDALVRDVKSKPPTLLIHGEDDEVVPPQSLELAQLALEAVNIPVETEMRPALGHGIDGPGLMRALEFMRRRLA